MPKNPAAVALGSIKSPRKAKTSAENGKLGGRPIREPRCPICRKMNIERSQNNNNIVRCHDCQYNFIVYKLADFAKFFQPSR